MNRTRQFWLMFFFIFAFECFAFWQVTGVNPTYAFYWLACWGWKLGVAAIYTFFLAVQAL